MQTIEGIVLKTQHMGEKELVQLFTKELGIISFVYKVSSRTKQAVSALVKAEALLIPSSKDLMKCVELTPLTSYPKLRTNLNLLILASKMLESIRNFLHR